MAVVFFKAYYTPPEGVEREVTNLINIQQSRGLELKSSKADLVIKNNQFRDKADGESIFQEDGLLEIYADYSPITRAANQLLLSGQVRQINFSGGEQGSQLKLTVADRTVLLLGSLQTAPFTNKTAPQMIKDLVSAATDDGDGGNSVTTTNVTTTNQDGAPFPNKNYYQTFKPVVDMITELSQPGYTGDDRPYQFYVDTDNDLQWFYPSQTSNGTITQGTDDIFEYTFKRSSDSVINMVIFNAGPDLRGNGVLWYHFDQNSKTNELRMKYQPMTDLSKELFDKEVSAGNLTESSGGIIPYPSKGQFYDDAAYNITTNWGEVVTDFDEYNDAYREQLKVKGKRDANKITTQFGKLLWKGTITLKGTNNYTAGDLLTINIPSAGITDYLLRVQDVVHSFQKGGWSTTLELKEDEEAITAAE